jgi:hypothetical protein
VPGRLGHARVRGGPVHPDPRRVAETRGRERKLDEYIGGSRETLKEYNYAIPASAPRNGRAWRLPARRMSRLIDEVKEKTGQTVEERIQLYRLIDERSAAGRKPK